MVIINLDFSMNGGLRLIKHLIFSKLSAHKKRARVNVDQIRMGPIFNNGRYTK